MSSILRNTSAANVIVHELALSVRTGDTALHIPRGEDGLMSAASLP
jgi:hypothetical protein